MWTSTRNKVIHSYPQKLWITLLAGFQQCKRGRNPYKSRKKVENVDNFVEKLILSVKRRKVINILCTNCS